MSRFSWKIRKPQASQEALDAIQKAQDHSIVSRVLRKQSKDLHDELKEQDFITLIENLFQGR